MNVKQYQKACRKLIPEGLVLLENQNNILPLKKDENIAIFFRSQFEYIKSGSGSGGRVHIPYITQLYTELKKYCNVDKTVSSFYKKWTKKVPYDTGDGWCDKVCQENPILDESFVIEASKRNEVALLMISRMRGEGNDSSPTRGEYYLSEQEEDTISKVSKHFKKVIVLINSGNIQDCSFIKKYNIPCVVYAYQGGQEGARGTVDALIGKTSPSGHLVDTIAFNLEDYPNSQYFSDPIKNYHVEDIFVGYRYFETFAKDKVLYPFGYGLSYSDFSVKFISSKVTSKNVTVKFSVTNVGNFTAKEVVQLYIKCPIGNLSQPSRKLIGFVKTKALKPHESKTYTIKASKYDFSSYDDAKKTEYPFSYVLEKGTYELFLGKNVRDAEKVSSFTIEKNKRIEKLSQCLAPKESFKRIANDKYGNLIYEDVLTQKKSPIQKSKNDLLPLIGYQGENSFTLEDVASRKATMEQLISGLSDQQLCYLVVGEGMSSPKASLTGTASVFGGVSPELLLKKVPIMTCNDGPSGVRLENYISRTQIPSGTLIASTWDAKVIKKVFEGFAWEVELSDSDVILGPGCNIHRHPLGGRNFEYFSEDPFVSAYFTNEIGKIFLDNGIMACAKHFAVNSQELKRGSESEEISERALREIYLKTFELGARTGNIPSIMTSYNRINGIHNSSNYDLCTSILRKEWNYKGLVMTDWWANLSTLDGGPAEKKNISNMVKAQNDIYMVCPLSTTSKNDLKEALESGYLSRAELERCSINILNFALKTLAFKNKKFEVLDITSDVGDLVIEKGNLKSYIKWFGPTPSTQSFDLKIKAGKYICEMDYSIDQNELNQISYHVGVGELWTTCQLILQGTEGKVNRTRFSIIVPENTTLSFMEKEVKVFDFRLFEIK